MSWPQATDYSAALQAPAHCFSDPELRQGQAAPDGLFGLPLTFSGNFANVYKLSGPEGQAWAVKCFTRPAPDRQRRYQRLSEHLTGHRKRFVVAFHFLDEGIRIGGAWAPVVKMRWVEGRPLNDFVRDHVDHPAVLARLARLWLRLAVGMRKLRIAHGDLQHGNVLLVPGQAGAMALRLVDYDGMWAPGLADLPPGEIGHANYQHPQRLREGGYGPTIDHFSLLVIYTALRALAVGGRPLWEAFDNGENLLFREADFRDPASSRLLPALLRLPDGAVQALVAHLVCASQGPLEAVPALSHLLARHTIAALSREQIARMAQLVPPARVGPAPVAPPPVIPPLPAAHPEPPAPLPPPPPAPQARPAPVPPRPRPRALVVGALALVPILALLGWFLVAGQRPGSPTPRALPRLLDAPAVPLRAGHDATVVLSLDRGEVVAPLRLEVRGLPTGVACSPAEVPRGTGPAAVAVHFTAPLEQPAARQAITFALLGPGEARSERQVMLTVAPYRRPRFGTLLPIRLTPGATVLVAPPVRANGSAGPWELRFVGLPGAVAVKPSPVPARGRMAVAALSARAGALPTASLVTVELLSEGQVADSRSVTLSIDPPAPVRVDVAAPASISLRAGGKAVVGARLTRHQHEGPIRLEVQGLPRGVEAPPVEVPPGAKAAEVVLAAAAAARAPRLLPRARLVARVDGKEVGACSFWLHLSEDTPTPPPVPVVVKPPAPREVTIPTADKLQLRGTLWLASEPLDGPCVLMVHDLRAGSHHKDKHWQRLALRLQGLGCSVLAFDLRGYGDNRQAKDVGASFWVPLPNAALRKGARDRPPASLDATKFPTWYAPFLVQDLIAARAFLDLRHDAKELNTRNLLLVAAGEGGQLATLWLATEARRVRVAGPFEMPAPESRDLVAAAWLDPAPRLAGRPLPRGAVTALKEEAHWPKMLYLCDRNNKASLLAAREQAKLFGQAANKSFEVEPGPAPGMGLLGAERAEKLVLEMVSVWKKGHEMRPWVARDLAKQPYVWDFRPRGLRVPAWSPDDREVRLMPLAELGLTALKLSR